MITFSQLWQFYLDSRFIYPEKYSQLAPYIRKISINWDKLLNSSEEIFKLFVNERKQIISCSIAVTRYYHKSWMVHHMASKSDPRGMQKVLLQSIRWMMNNQLLDYGIFYWQPRKRGVNDRFSDLGAMIGGGSLEVSRENLLDYYTFSVQPEPPLKWDLGLAMSAVSSRESPAIIRLLSKHLDQREMDIRSLSPRHLELSPLDRVYRSYGLTRKRQVYKATLRNKVIAVVLWERASLGLNFSHFFNKFQIYFVGSPLESDTRTVVVSEVLSFLKRQCLEENENFLTCICGPKLSGYLQKLGFKPLRQYMRISISRKLENAETMKHFENFYSRRLKRK